MDHQKLHSLLSAYFNNTISHDDLTELLTHLKDAPEQETDQLIDTVLSELKEEQSGPTLTADRAAHALDQIKTDNRFTTDLPVRFLARNSTYQMWFSVAAVLLLIVSAGIFLVKWNAPKSGIGSVVANTVKPAAIVPGGNKATLTLSGGEVIDLDEIKTGLVSKREASSIIKTAEGKLVYDRSAGKKEIRIAQNILSTPKGGEYQLTLSDGTLVHLNSSSSLSFPAQFSGKERIVKLTGEAYFEVAKNKDKPFFVAVNSVKVKVLGTHFNINAYDKSVVTTLLEGSVKIAKNNRESLIVPGQQAVVADNSDQINISEAKIGQAIAWTKGYFKFEDDDIVTVMKQISRWYDVDVEYRGNFEQHHIGGTFARSKSITELLAYLEKVGKVHFKINERRITVMK